MTLLADHLRAQNDSKFFWHRVRHHTVLRSLSRTRVRTLLDIGAGAGFLGDYLQERRDGVRYCFVEPIAEMEGRLVDRFGSESNYKTRENFHDVDVVTLLDVLEHQQDDCEFLKSIVRKTAPGTVFVITVPALQSLWSSWDDALGHYRRYDKDSLARVLAAVGLERRDLFYSFPELLPAAMWRRLTRRDAQASVEFPSVSPLVNHGMFLAGVLTYTARSLVPLGTSVVAVAQTIASQTSSRQRSASVSQPAPSRSRHAQHPGGVVELT